MDKEKLLQYAAEEGFAAAAVIKTEEIVFDSVFRSYCEENLCGQYGVNYSCPPVCGTPEEMKAKILNHRYALVLQTMWEIADYSDKDAIREAKGSHNSGTLRLMKRLRGEGYEGFSVGASGCALCKSCAITQNENCRFPDQMFSCMSAYCIFVRKLTEVCEMEYNLGDGLLAFFGMFVFD